MSTVVFMPAATPPRVRPFFFPVVVPCYCRRKEKRALPQSL